MKKIIRVDMRARKEIKDFPSPVRLQIHELIRVLGNNGILEKPDGKKLVGHNNLFEMRIRYLGQWRVIYAYYLKDSIVILTAFQKKTQRTPTQTIKRAINRFKGYF